MNYCTEQAYYQEHLIILAYAARKFQENLLSSSLCIYQCRLFIGVDRFISTLGTLWEWIPVAVIVLLEAALGFVVYFCFLVCPCYINSTSHSVCIAHLYCRLYMTDIVEPLMGSIYWGRGSLSPKHSNFYPQNFLMVVL